METFPKIPAFAKKDFEEGWTQIIGKILKKYVETAIKEESL
jgi:hypothetical protein